MDCIKFDNGTLADHNDIWNNVSYLSREEEYSTLFTSTATGLIYTSITSDIAIEVDLMSTMASGGDILSIRNIGTTIENISLSECGMQTNEWKTVKLLIKDNKLTVIDGTISDLDVTNYNRLYIRSSQNYYTYFKNVRIYSI